MHLVFQGPQPDPHRCAVLRDRPANPAL